MHYARGPFVRWPQGPTGLRRAQFALDLGLQTAPGAPAVDRVLIWDLNTSKELSFLQEVSYVYQENSLRRLHIGGQNVLAAGAAEVGEQGQQFFPF